MMLLLLFWMEPLKAPLVVIPSGATEGIEAEGSRAVPTGRLTADATRDPSTPRLTALRSG